MWTTYEPDFKTHVTIIRIRFSDLEYELRASHDETCYFWLKWNRIELKVNTLDRNTRWVLHASALSESGSNHQSVRVVAFILVSFLRRVSLFSKFQGLFLYSSVYWHEKYIYKIIPKKKIKILAKYFFYNFYFI